MTDILSTIAAYASERVEASKKRKSFQEVKAEAEAKAQAEFKTAAEGKKEGKSANFAAEILNFPFENALQLQEIAFICEVKKASPSKGIICEDFPYLEIAKEYENAGAAAISVLTEPKWFQGRDEYLTEIRNTVKLPILRKDFTVDPYQIYEAKLIGAHAVLLICALLSDEQLKEFIGIADSLGLSALVEAHTEKEIQAALNAGARVIGVNNRDLKTFDVDIRTSTRLRKLVPENILFISESGIRTAEDIAELRKNKVNGVLIGETLMKSSDKKKQLAVLRGSEPNRPQK